MDLLEIVLKRSSKEYKVGERVNGYIQVQVPQGKPLSHNGIKFRVEGEVNITYSNSTKNIAAWENMVKNLKPLKLLELNSELAQAGKFTDTVELPFEFILKPTQAQTLFETYHGVYLNVRYMIHVEMMRGFLAKDVKKSLEFYVQVPGQGLSPNFKQLTPQQLAQQRIKFSITPQKLSNIKKNFITYVPDFLIEGSLDMSDWDISKPLQGEIIVKKSAVDIKSIELQLVRAESAITDPNSAITEKTEIQNLQMADGDVCKDTTIPIYMMFPRFFTCPTLKTKLFSIEFEVNVIIIFVGGVQITENCKINLYRSDLIK